MLLNELKCLPKVLKNIADISKNQMLKQSLKKFKKHIPFLGDETKRRQYDRFGSAALGGGAGASSYGGYSSGFGGF